MTTDRLILSVAAAQYELEIVATLMSSIGSLDDGPVRQHRAIAWQEGYRAGIDDWPSCALACGACDECQSEITFNPYRAETVDG